MNENEKDDRARKAESLLRELVEAYEATDLTPLDDRCMAALDAAREFLGMPKHDGRVKWL